jgi:hypothetical protein
MIKSEGFFWIKSKGEALSADLKMPSIRMELKKNGIVFDKRNWRRLLLTGSK